MWKKREKEKKRIWDFRVDRILLAFEQAMKEKRGKLRSIANNYRQSFFFSLSLVPRFRSRYGSGHPASRTATPLWRSTRRNARLSTDTTINARVAEWLRVRFRSSPLICLVEAGRQAGRCLSAFSLVSNPSFAINRWLCAHAHAHAQRRYVESSPTTLASFSTWIDLTPPIFDREIIKGKEKEKKKNVRFAKGEGWWRGWRLNINLYTVLTTIIFHRFIARVRG